MSFLLASSCVVSFFDLFLLLTPEKQNHLMNKMVFISFFLKETHGIWLTHLPPEVQCLQLALSLFQPLYHTFVSAFLCGNQPPRCPVVCSTATQISTNQKFRFWGRYTFTWEHLCLFTETFTHRAWTQTSGSIWLAYWRAETCLFPMAYRALDKENQPCG